MGGWYVRDRGRVIGPLTTEQVLDLRDRGQLQGYHEVSTDRRGWRAVDLVPELSGTAPPPPPRHHAPPPPPEAPRNRTYALVVGGVAAAVLVGGLAIGGVLLLRGGRVAGDGAGGGDAPPAAGPLPAGVVELTGKPAATQEQLLRGSVGLVVSGMQVTYPDGTKQEAMACLVGPGGEFRFGNVFDYIVTVKQGNEVRKGLLPGYKLVVDFGSGSGFAVTPTGHILTNKHVIEKIHAFAESENRASLQALAKLKIEPKVWVFFGLGQKFVAAVVHVSGGYDLAVLKIDRQGGPYFPLCSTPSTDIPATLRDLSAVGFPGVDRDVFSDQDVQEATRRREIRKGTIENILPGRAFDFSHREGSITTRARLDRVQLEQKESWIIQHTAQIFGGNSGGPLVTKDGLVLGLNTWGGGQAVENRNYALTLPQLRAEIDGATGKGVAWRDLPK